MIIRFLQTNLLQIMHGDLPKEELETIFDVSNILGLEAKDRLQQIFRRKKTLQYFYFGNYLLVLDDYTCSHEIEETNDIRLDFHGLDVFLVVFLVKIQYPCYFLSNVLHAFNTQCLIVRTQHLRFLAPICKHLFKNVYNTTRLTALHASFFNAVRDFDDQFMQLSPNVHLKTLPCHFRAEDLIDVGEDHVLGYGFFLRGGICTEAIWSNPVTEFILFEILRFDTDPTDDTNSCI